MRVVPSVVVVVLGALVGCNVEGPAYEADRRAEPVAPEPPTEPAPHRADEPPPPPKVDLALAAGLEMRRPIRDGRLTLIPIIATDRAALARAPELLTLADGMARNLVTITEVSDEDWDVDWVRVTNRSALPLALLGGELIIDGKQDRIIGDDVVIAPNSVRHVPARCVEEKREEGGVRFHDGGAIAELSLRRTLVHESQESIWWHVGQINARNGLRPATRTYRHSAALLAQGAAAARRAALVAQLAELEERDRMVGLAVAIDDEVVAIDRLATPALYRALEGRLLASYLPTTASVTAPIASAIAPDAVRTFAKRRTKTTPASAVVLRPRARR